MRRLHALLVLALCSACATSKVVEDSQLDRWLGTWDGVATTSIEGVGSVEVHATSTLEWARPGEALLERTVSEVGGETHTSLALWVWDPAAQACRTYRIRSDGTREDGLARHTGKGETWKLEARSEDPETGRVTSGSGTLRFEGRDLRVYDWVTSVDGTVATRVEGSSQRR